MSIWLVPVLLACAGLVWLELRRPNRRHLVSRVAAVLVAVAALVALLAVRRARDVVTLLTPGAPLSARSRTAVGLEQAQSLGGLAGQRLVRLAGWGLLPHEWPDSTPPLAGFDRAPLPDGLVRIDAPTEVGVGARLVVRGTAVPGSGEPGMVILEDPAGPRDSAAVSAADGEFELEDRPRAAGAAEYRLRLRVPGQPEQVETLAVAVRVTPMPATLVLDASPSFETAALKRWLAERGARVTVRTAISRDRYRTEGLNQSADVVGALTAQVLNRFDLVLADGGSLAGLGPSERAALERQVKERGLGLLITADLPSVIARCGCGVAAGFALDPIAVATIGPRDKGDRRIARPVLPGAPRQSRTGLEADAASLKPGSAESLVQDEVGRVIAGWRRAGRGRVAATLLRTPSRWLLEGETDLYAAYWYTMLQAVTRDTTTRVTVSAEGPLRPDHPVTIALTLADPPPPAGFPTAVVVSPAGATDTLALAQDPFDPSRFTGRYWPRAAGWHRVGLGNDRVIPFRVTAPGEWVALEAGARLAATAPRIAPPTLASAMGTRARRWLAPLAFALLVLSLTWLWIEGRRAG